MKDTNKKTASGYVVIDYLRSKHPEAEDTFKIERLYEGEVEQASILVGNIYVSQRSTIMPSNTDSVLFKDRTDTNRRFSVRLSNIGVEPVLELNEALLKGQLSTEILNLIELFGL